jgi:serine/threonine protein kinase
MAIKNSRQMYLHEVKVLRLLGRHPNIVHLYGISHLPNLAYHSDSPHCSTNIDDCEGPRHFHLLLECLSGGELYERYIIIVFQYSILLLMLIYELMLMDG